jgi:tetratricopeptide (TPR) repeat protein
MTKAPTQRPSPDGFVVATFNQAMAAHRAGDLPRAEALYKLVLAHDATQFDAMHMLGVVAGQRGNFREGVRLIADALKIRPNATDGYINLGRMQAELKDYAGACASYRKVLGLNPNLPLAHNNFSIALRRQGQCEEALLHCDKAIALAPNYPEA